MEREKIELIVEQPAKDEEEACLCACGGTMCGAQTIEFVSLAPLPAKPLSPHRRKPVSSS